MRRAAGPCGFRYIFDGSEIIIDRGKRSENRNERLWWHRLENKSRSVFPDDCILAGQLEFTGNTNGLVAPILKELNESRRTDIFRHMPSIGHFGESV